VGLLWHTGAGAGAGPCRRGLTAGLVVAASAGSQWQADEQNVGKVDCPFIRKHHLGLTMDWHGVAECLVLTSCDCSTKMSFRPALES
jgi:hypothetical protein